MTADPARWLVLRLEAPLIAYGGVAIDAVGPTRDFPALSMLTGLLANALGWDRAQRDDHDALQDRLVFAARCDRPGQVMTDTQNVGLAKTDRGWTTGGQPEGRQGASYGAPHRRQRDYLAEASTTVVLTLRPADRVPDLETIERHLERPMRPLFVGRKPCLPTSPVLSRDKVFAATAFQALSQVPGPNVPLLAQWPVGEGPQDGEAVDRVIALADRRKWRTGLHGGTRQVVEGRVVPT
jgi:CRISPR system Cascade subunit CasD